MSRSDLRTNEQNGDLLIDLMGTDETCQVSRKTPEEQYSLGFPGTNQQGSYVNASRLGMFLSTSGDTVATSPNYLSIPLSNEVGNDITEGLLTPLCRGSLPKSSQMLKGFFLSDEGETSLVDSEVRMSAGMSPGKKLTNGKPDVDLAEKTKYGTRYDSNGNGCLFQ